MHDEGARQADPLAHAARQLLGIGGFESVKSDQVDRGERTRLALLGGNSLRLKPDFHVLQHGQPREQSEALKHHGDLRGRSIDGLAVDRDRAAGWRHQAGDDPQQSGLAAARTAQQGDDFVGTQFERDILQHEQIVAAAFVIGARHAVDFDQRRVSQDAGPLCYRRIHARSL